MTSRIRLLPHILRRPPNLLPRCKSYQKVLASSLKPGSSSTRRNRHQDSPLFESLNGPLSAGKCRHSTSFIPFSWTHLSPSAVYTSAFHSVAMNRSLLSRRDAINMNTWNAVSENPNPLGSGSHKHPTSKSTASISPAYTALTLAARALLPPVSARKSRAGAMWKRRRKAL